MGDPTDRRDGGEKKTQSGSDDEADLSARLDRLRARLGEAEARRDGGGGGSSRAASDMSGVGKAFRFSAEFIAGVIAGTALGWAIDQVAGTTPWAMLVGLILGFCAGMLNILRAAGELNRKPGSGTPPRGQGEADETRGSDDEPRA